MAKVAGRGGQSTCRDWLWASLHALQEARTSARKGSLIPEPGLGI